MFNWLRSMFRGNRVGKSGGDTRNLRARYDAAQTNNENVPLWQMTDYLSAKAANSFGVRRILKIRSRYEAANNSYFRGIIDSIANDLIGTGPKLQIRTKDPEVNRAIENAWSAWASVVSLPEKLRTITKAKIQDGEGFFLLVTNRALRATLGGKLGIDDAVQLDIIPIESDQVTTPSPGFIDYFWVDGMVLDKLGQPTEYHVLRTHPGDFFIPQLNPLIFDKWPPRLVAHWFRVDRPGQVRGIPEITPALELFGQLRRYTKAVLLAAETAADFAVVLETQAPADLDDEPVEGEHIYLERGMATTLPWGVKAAQLKAEQPTNTYESFTKNLLREICRCLQVPLNIALGDSSGYNYSSGRLDHLSYHRRQHIDRAHCEQVVLGKIFKAWLEEAVMVPGLLPAGLSPSNIGHRWFWDSAESIDPVKDATTDQIRLLTGTTTLQEIYAERGIDWEEAIRQRAAELELMASLGMAVPMPPGVTSTVVNPGTSDDEEADSKEPANA